MKKIKYLSITMLMLTFLCISFKSYCIRKGSGERAVNRQIKSGLINNNKITISGRFLGNNVPKEVSLIVWDNIISVDKRMFTRNRKFSAPVKDGKFSFTVNGVRKTSYISFGWGNSGQDINIFEYLKTYLTSPGDNVVMNISDYQPQNPNKNNAYMGLDSAGCTNCKQFSFSGIGSSKYQCRYEMDMIKEDAALKFVGSEKNRLATNYTFIDFSQYRERDVNFYKFDQLSCLGKYKGKITPDIFDLLKVDILSAAFYRLSKQVWFYLPRLEDTTNKHRDEDRTLIKSYIKKLEAWTKDINPDILARSAEYSKFLLNDLIIENRMSGKESVQQMIVARYIGVLRERLILANILDNAWMWDQEVYDRDTKNVETLIKRPGYKEALDSLLNTKKIGAEVYNFSLTDTAGKIVRLEDFKGKVVFMDFWFVGCSGCSDYYEKVVSKTEELFKDNPGVMFITMSIDRDRNKWMKGVNSGEYTSKSVINLYSKEGSSDPIVKKFNVLSYPHPLLIDANGNLFSNSNKELRENGVTGLVDMINKAIATK